MAIMTRVAVIEVTGTIAGITIATIIGNATTGAIGTINTTVTRIVPNIMNALTDAGKR